MEIRKTDALVIGGGIAGLVAANETANNNIKTTVLYTGRGASTDIFGINILGLKRPELKNDSYEIFYKDTIGSGCKLNGRDLLETLITNTAGISDYIKLIGLDLNDPKQFSLTRPLGCSFPRAVFYYSSNKSLGVVLLRFLRKRISDYKINVVNNISITHLLKNNDSIIGAYGFNTISFSPIIIKAKAVILATGGFSNIFNFTTTFSTINGFCHAAAYNIGAELTDMEFVQFEPAVSVYPKKIRGIPIPTTMLNNGAEIYNKKREKIIKGGYPNKNILSHAMYGEIIHGKATENGGLFFDATLLGEKFLDENYPGFISKFIKGGIDIRKDLLEVAPAAHYCCGGIKINKECNTSIKGLFACGEIVGGIHGANRLGGNAGAETLVFGGIAGRSAVDYIKNHTKPKVKNELLQDKIVEMNEYLGNKSTNKPIYGQIIKDLRNAISESANIIRDKNQIEEGIKKLAILKERNYKSISADSCEKEKFNYFSIDNMITIGQILLYSANLRKESRGTHNREDYPKIDDNKYLKNIIVKKYKDSPGLYLKEIE